MVVMSKTQEWKAELEARLEAFCRERGYVLSPSKEAIIRDMVAMRGISGDFYCPCQPENTPDTVCVCLPARQGLVDEQGACFCYLVLKGPATDPGT